MKIIINPQYHRLKQNNQLNCHLSMIELLLNVCSVSIYCLPSSSSSSLRSMSTCLIAPTIVHNSDVPSTNLETKQNKDEEHRCEVQLCICA